MCRPVPGLWLVVILAILGGLVGHHLGGGHRGRGGSLSTATWYGVAGGAAVGILLPTVFGIVAALFHVLFVVALVVAAVLAILAVMRAFR